MCVWGLEWEDRLIAKKTNAVILMEVSDMILNLSSVNTYNISQVVLVVKNLSVSAGEIRETGWIPAWGRSLEEEMATHSSIRGILPRQCHRQRNTVGCDS